MEPHSYIEKLAQRISDAFAELGITLSDPILLKQAITISPSADKGHFSLPLFRFCPKGKNPKELATEIVNVLKKKPDEFFSKYEGVGPYINVWVNPVIFAHDTLERAHHVPPIPDALAPRVMVEYGSPNTNKPLHVGHLRNIALATSIIRLYEHEGNRVVKVQVINDRGVHICKSMLAYQKWGNNQTPETSGMKSDAFVGKYYTLFAQRAKEDPKLEEEAQELLKKWEEGDKDTHALWKKMNAWTEKGIFDTYRVMGALFDKNYYESELYLHGKEVVEKAKATGLFEIAENGAIIAPLEKKFGLPDMPVMRGDGTSLYITQDIYLTMKRFEEYPDLEKMVYVVGNEQEMRFKQLFAILQLLGVEKATKCYHLGYGLLVLPSGKMSSREGTVVNADELIEELETSARAEYNKRSPELGTTEIERRSRVISLAALKFHLVKQDARKDIVFDPQESLSFEGQTGPYLLYTNARIQSVLSKSGQKPSLEKMELLNTEGEEKLLFLLAQKQAIIQDALGHFSPHILCNYLLHLANTFNTYYHETKIIQEDVDLEKARLALIDGIHSVLEEGMHLLGIETLKEM